MREFIQASVIFIVLLVVLSLCADNTRASRLDISNHVEVELIIAVDTSGSITEKEYNLQKEGIISAFRSKEFENFLINNKYGISVIYMEWAADSQQQYTKWHRINSLQDAEILLHEVKSMQRMFLDTTAIYAAMLKALELFDNNPYPGIRKVIDISGDGKNSWYGVVNSTVLLEARDKLIEKGITINGLPIIMDSYVNDLEDYYKEFVIGGPRAFSLPAKTYEEYGDVFLRKLLTEIG